MDSTKEINDGNEAFFRDWSDEEQPRKCSNNKSKTYNPPNPDPSRFTIKRIEKINNYIWVLVNYPDCTTYRGDKILIFRSVPVRRIKLYSRLDPHFSESGLSPVARFRPDTEGTILSRKFCELC